MRTALIGGLAAVVFLFVPSAANAHHASGTKCHNKALITSYSAHYYAVRETFGKRAPGRNIRKYGLTDQRRSKCRHLRRSLRTLKSMRVSGGAARLLTTGKPYTPPAGTATVQAGGVLSRIAACESGGNPRAVSQGGTYRGKYQFDYQTWASVGGSGDPAAASEAEQDRRAAILYSRRGAQPWPVCGRR